MALTKDGVISALRSLKDATTDADLVSLGLVKKVAVCDGFVSVDIACADDEPVRAHLRSSAEAAIKEFAERDPDPDAVVNKVTIGFVLPDSEAGRAPGVGEEADGKAGVDHPRSIPLKQASSSETTRSGTAKASAASAALPGVRNVIAVGAGKGGVGKSTVAVNLAVGLARRGHSVGVLDADIYGPSLPTLLGLDSLDVTLHRNMLQVFYVHGIKAMTIGKLVDPEKPLIWRGPMAHGAFKQLAEQTDWGELDYLIVDLPPGTGDVPLTMSQLMSLTGAIVVCTPQKVAQDDAVRAVRMFQQLKIEVLGIVENMSVFIGDDGKEYDIFGRGGAEMMAQRLGLPFLGALPLNMAVRQHSDDGTPVKNFTDAGERMQKALESFVKQAEAQAMLASGRMGASRPEMTIS